MRWFVLSAACLGITSGAFWLLTGLASPDSGWAILAPVIFVPWGLSLLATALLLLSGICRVLAPPLRAIARWAGGPEVPHGRGTHLLAAASVPPGFVPPSAAIAPSCAHPDAVPVELLGTGELVAWICPDCGVRLRIEVSAPAVPLSAHALRPSRDHAEDIGDGKV